jgi:hypothetical protein
MMKWKIICTILDVHEIYSFASLRDSQPRDQQCSHPSRMLTALAKSS